MKGKKQKQKRDTMVKKEKQINKVNLTRRRRSFRIKSERKKDKNEGRKIKVGGHS